MNIIGAFDRGRVSTLEPRPKSVLIMITGYNRCIDDGKPEFPDISKKWYKTLPLIFDDIDGKSPDGITDILARQILDFVVEHINCDIFISCDAGLSRSPAVVVALEQIFNCRDVSDRYPHHNKFVKNRIKDVWFKRIWSGKEEET